MNVKHDKQKVLERGYDLFWTKGYANLGVDEICKTTGMTKGAFYNAFKSKENFLLEGIKEYGKMSACVHKHLLSPLGNKKAITRLRSLYEWMFEAQSKMNCRGCLVMNMMSELGTLNPVVRKATLHEFNNIISTIESTVKEAQKEGDLIKNVTSKNLTDLIHTTFIGSLTCGKGLKSNKKGKKTMTLLINSLST